MIRGKGQQLFAQRCQAVLLVIKQGAKRKKDIVRAVLLSNGYVSDILTALYQQGMIKGAPGQLAVTAKGEQFLGSLRERPMV